MPLGIALTALVQGILATQALTGAGPDEAIALIDAFDFGDAPDENQLLTKAELLHDARDYERAGKLFAQLIDHYPDRRTRSR